MIVNTVGAPHDVYHHTSMSFEANQLNNQAMVAYQRGDIAEALRIIKEAHLVAPTSSIVLYNLACFNALSGNQDEALTWLEKAVDAGFQAPNKINSDSDLESLRGHPRYQAALDKASKVALRARTDDVVLNSSKKGEAFKLSMQAWQVYEQNDYEQGLKLVEQAYEVAPKDSRVLYYLSCFHALLGHDDRALDFLDQAVDGGFYCPQHISKDPDLERIRPTQRYRAAVERAQEKAAEATTAKSAEKVTLVKKTIDRLMCSVGVLDYVASVESTVGYEARSESLVALVPDAKKQPIFAVFGKRKPLDNFERYLPRETVSFSVSNGIDVGALYGFLEDTFREAGPQGEELLAKWEGIQEAIGFNVKQDLIGWIDGQSVSVTLENGRGWVLLMKVDDEQVAREKCGATLDLLSRKLTEAMTEVPMLAMLMMRRTPVQSEKLNGFEALYIGMSPQPIIWGVSDGHLILSDSVTAVALCLDTAQGTHPSIRDNQRVMSEALLPKGDFTSMTLTDRRNLGRELSTMLGMISMFSGTASIAVPDPQAKMVIAKITSMIAKLSPVVLKIDFYKSHASYTTFDGQAWHTRQVTHYFSPDERAARKPPPPTSAPAEEKATEGL